MTEFLKAFVKVQKALKPAKKDSLNPHFKSKYANLESCYEACRDVLSDNGFVVLQVPWISEEGATILRTDLYHVSGQVLIGQMFVCAKDTTAQARGSALTYSRRYSLVTIVGLATEDDDGQAATQGHVKSKPQGGVLGPIKKQIPNGDFLIPASKTFGAYQGKKVKDVPKEHLEKMLQHCIDKQIAPELQEAILTHLDIITQTDELPPFEEFDR